MTPTTAQAQLQRADPAALSSVGAGLLAALPLVVGLFVSPLMTLAVVSPLPVMVHRLRAGLGGGLLAAAVAAALVGALTRPLTAAVFLLLLLVPGLLIAEGLARGRGLRRGCAWAFTLLVAVVTLLLLTMAPRMATELIAPFEEMRQPGYLDQFRQAGWAPERVDEFADLARLWSEALAVVYPAAYVVLAALVVFVNAALLRTYLARRDPGWLEGGEFEEIRWPLALGAAFLVLGCAVFVPALRAPACNGLVVLAFFFGLEGLAVVAYYVHRLAGPPLLRTALLVLVLMTWARWLLLPLGLVDIYLDLRKWARPRAA